MKHTGIIALSLFAIVFVLALKNKIVNRWFVSLAQQYRVHHLAALGVALLAGVHVITEFAALPREDWSIYWALGEASISTAWAGFALLLIGVGASWLNFKRYSLWYALHLVLIPAFFLAAWHAILMAEKSRPLTIIIAALILITCGAIFIIWFDKRKSRALSCTLVSVREISAGISELHLSAAKSSEQPRFSAGAVIYLRFDAPDFSRQWHPFSVASCASEPDLRLLIKGFGADTLSLSQLAPGETVFIKGPYRELSPDFTRPQIWIAGGIGIAAFAGFWACLQHKQSAQIEIWHFVKDAGETITAETLGLNHPATGCMTFHTIVEKSTYLTALQNLVPTLQKPGETQFIISGPPAFMRAVRRKIQRDGIKRSQIHTEEFTPW